MFELLAALARSQGGMLTARQAADSGISRRVLDAWVADGSLVRRRRGLYVVPAARPGDAWTARVQQALLMAGPDAVAAGETAARLQAIAGAEPLAPITVMVPPAAHHARLAGVRVVRAPLRDDDVTVADGVPVTTPLRTAVDCARRSAHEVAVCLIESAARQELLAVADVAAAVDALRLRTPGVARARRALTRIDVRSESPLETVARLLLLDNGFVYPELQLPFVAGEVAGRVDLAYPAALLGLPGRVFCGLAIEADGREPHLREAMFHHDRIRQTALEEAGWLVRRFTAPHLNERPAYVVATVRRALDRVAAA